MNKRIAIIIVILIVIGGGIWYFMSRGGVQPTPGGVTPKVTAGQTIKELLAGNRSQKCTFSDEESQISGTVYVANGLMRGDYSYVTDGQPTNAHMIMKGDTSYTWMEGMATGYIVKLDLNANVPPSNVNEGVEAVDMNKKFDYRCSNWMADNSMFIPPANVNFTDLSSMIPSSAAPVNNSLNMPMDSNAARCAVCDRMNAQLRTQCRTSMRCD